MPPVSIAKKTIRDIDPGGKRIFVRCDFNVPQDETGAITDDRRIREALPTLQYLLERGGRLILASHLGRPKGIDKKYSLAPVAKRLTELLKADVPLAPDCIGPDVAALVQNLSDGQAMLLENVRFHDEETENDPEFSANLAALAEIYVNDAFGSAHRAHSSTEGIAHILPGVAGFLMEKEIEFLGNALDDPKRPFVAILGGAKVKDKIAVVENLLNKVDTLLIGGGMMFTFVKAAGGAIGNSLLDADNLGFAKRVLDGHSNTIRIAHDAVTAKQMSATASTTVCSAGNIPLISGRIPPRNLQTLSKAPEQQFGTARWVCSN
jgi:phosphoglycerate kinase